MVVRLLRERMKSKDRWANNAILLGDFNIFTTNDKTFVAGVDFGSDYLTRKTKMPEAQTTPSTTGIPKS
jgi:hypothetical protein